MGDAKPNTLNIRPQEGFQGKFLSSRADIAIGGGAAGAGKTWALLAECTRNYDNGDFGAVVFRRTFPQIEMEGGLWDESVKLFPYFGAKENLNKMMWRFPSGMKVSFRHLQYDTTVHQYQGAQIPLICFDELTHFSKYVFFYLLSRNRKSCGVKPYIRATCNPDPSSWLAEFIEWWIDQETGYPIPERDGVLRYFTQDGGSYVWGDTPREVMEKAPSLFASDKLKKSGVDLDDLIKSVTFIAGDIYDNKVLLSENPAYLGNLLALDEDEKLRLLDSNWKVRMDGKNICKFDAVKALIGAEILIDTRRVYITIDDSRYGRDFTVMCVWEGWRIIWMSILTKSSAFDTYTEADKLRRRYGVKAYDVMIDQDGVGGDTLKLGGYRGFRANDPPTKIDKTNKLQNYKNFKTQCVYEMGEKINAHEVSVLISARSCCVDGAMTTMIRVGRRLVDVRELIKDDLNSYRTKDRDFDQKKQIEGKDLQKELLGGRSPDFGDNFVMRRALDLIPTYKKAKRNN